MHGRNAALVAAATTGAAMALTALPAVAAGGLVVKNGNPDNHITGYADSVTLTDHTVGVGVTWPQHRLRRGGAGARRDLGL
ncbi:hypothetical protein [Amycolatopsis pigmentata]|uniref:Uncharacterized protein n=1 Tax=Amycolatopsis pigmentata TaxID=450801 RepID=A0ABW5G4D6_9PSEU